jgi:cytochrome c oxidase subunit 2
LIGALGIFPASVGFNITYLTIIFVMGTLITVVALIAVVYSTRRPEEGDSHALAKYEKHWVALIVVIFVIFSASTLAYLPYPYAHTNIKPNMIVDVQAQQFAWCLSPAGTWGQPNCESNVVIPLGSTVYFNVSSIDVTHGFGVYDAAGSIQFQVQVMPGFYNNIMYQFTSPGTYYIRCLEFCGYGHYLMISQVLNVTSS